MKSDRGRQAFLSCLLAFLLKVFKNEYRYINLTFIFKLATACSFSPFRVGSAVLCVASLPAVAALAWPQAREYEQKSLPGSLSTSCLFSGMATVVNTTVHWALAVNVSSTTAGRAVGLDIHS